VLNWLDYASSLSILIPALTAILVFGRLNAEMRILALLFIFAAFIEGLNFLSAANSINNVWLINIYSLIEGSILIFILSSWNKYRLLKQAFNLALIIYVLFWIVTTLIINNIFHFNEVEKTAKGILLILISGIILMQNTRTESVKLFRSFVFWITSAILIYFSLTLIIFTTAIHLLNGNHEAMEYSWQIHSVVNILTNIFFANGLRWYYLRKNMSI
jgi:hypothetical protein